MPEKYHFYPLQFSAANFFEQIALGISPRYLPPVLKGNFRDADLSGLDLTGVTFAHLDMSNAKLRNCRFDESVFSECDLTGADFSGSSMLHTTINDCQLGRASLSGCSIRISSFADNNFHGTDFSKARFETGTLNGSNLTGAKFEGERKSTRLNSRHLVARMRSSV